MSDSSSGSLSSRARRDSVILNARVEAVDTAVECRVRNLSTTGACIDNVGNLPLDGRVLVTMGKLHHIEGRVCWAADGRAGLHFDNVLIDVAAARQPRGTVAPVPRHLAGWLSNIHSPYRRGND